MGIFSNFFGGDQRHDIREGERKANRLIDQGRDRAQGYFDEGREEAQGFLTPFVEGGQQGQEFYDDLIGLNGGAARDARQQFVASDAAFQGQLGQDQNALLRNLNARGVSGSGLGALAAERVFQQNYGNVLNRYANRGQQGFQAANAGANVAQNFANQSGNLQFGAAQQKAQNTGSAFNAIGQTRSTGLNNLLGIAGVGAKAYGAYTGKGAF